MAKELAEMLKPVLAEQERTGVRVLPEWFEADRTLFYSERGFMDEPGSLDSQPDAAALVAVGAMASWLNKCGIDLMANGDDLMKVCIAATLAVLKAMPDAKGAARD